jgi:hypothetical protein
MKELLDKVCYTCCCLEIANHAVGLHVKKQSRLLQDIDGVALGFHVNESP